MYLFTTCELRKIIIKKLNNVRIWINVEEEEDEEVDIILKYIFNFPGGPRFILKRAERFQFEPGALNLVLIMFWKAGGEKLNSRAKNAENISRNRRNILY